MDFWKIFGEYGVEKYIAHIELILTFVSFSLSSGVMDIW
jgi:hypothetical protein